jgi:hypothetical protein
VADLIREHILKRFNGNPPVRPESIVEFEARSGIRLPNEYKTFLLRSNGGEGFVGEAYVMLSPLEDLLEMNAGYEVEINAPGLFLFGSDGGGEAFAFRLSCDAGSVVMFPWIGVDEESIIDMVPSFNPFLERLYGSGVSF